MFLQPCSVVKKDFLAFAQALIGDPFRYALWIIGLGRTAATLGREQKQVNVIG